MKKNIFACGLISATLVAGVISIFSGCADEESTQAITIESSSSYYVPASSYEQRDTASLVSPIRVSDFHEQWNGNKTSCTFQGSALLDAWDTLANVDSQNDPFFTNVYLDLARVDENGNVLATPLNNFFTYDPGSFPRAVINFTQMGASIIDPDKTECGTYRLIAYFYATNDTMGTAGYNPNKFVTIDTLTFTREPEYCIEVPVESSSSEAIVSTVELVMAEADMSTNATRGFSFVTGTEVPAAEAQIGLALTEEEELILKGLNGFRVTEYSNQADKNWDDDWYSKKLPPEPAHLSDFRFNQASLGEVYEDGFDVALFYVAIGPNYNPETGEDFYAVTLKEKQNKDANGVMRVTIIYYKKK